MSWPAQAPTRRRRWSGRRRTPSTRPCLSRRRRRPALARPDRQRRRELPGRRDHRGRPQHRPRRSPEVIPLRDANPTRRRPVVTIGLIAVCVIAFAYELGVGADGGDPALDRLFRDWALVPRDLTNALGGAGAPGTLARELGT